MPLPKRKCTLCDEEFELRPDKPGLASHCPTCTEFEAEENSGGTDVLATDREANAARRDAMRNMLYRKDS